jgi:hypothetical protein
MTCRFRHCPSAGSVLSFEISQRPMLNIEGHRRHPALGRRAWAVPGAAEPRSRAPAGVTPGPGARPAAAEHQSAQRTVVDCTGVSLTPMASANRLAAATSASSDRPCVPNV